MDKGVTKAFTQLFLGWNGEALNTAGVCQHTHAEPKGSVNTANLVSCK